MHYVAYDGTERSVGLTDSERAAMLTLRRTLALPENTSSILLARVSTLLFVLSITAKSPDIDDQSDEHSSASFTLK